MGSEEPTATTGPDEVAEAFRRTYVASHRPRLTWPLLPWFLFTLGVGLLAVAAVIDVTEDRVPEGFVRVTGRVVDVRDIDCPTFARSCDSRVYRVAWIDTDGEERTASFNVGVGDPDVGDPFDLRYQPDGPSRAQEMGEGYYFIVRTRIAAAVCILAALVAAGINVRRGRRAARRAPARSGGSAGARGGAA